MPARSRCSAVEMTWHRMYLSYCPSRPVDGIGPGIETGKVTATLSDLAWKVWVEGHDGRYPSLLGNDHSPPFGSRSRI